MWWSLLLSLALKWGVPALLAWLSEKFPNAKWIAAVADALLAFEGKMAESPELKAMHEAEALARLKKIRKGDSSVSAPWNTKGVE